jgi:hypothetical protein
MVRRVPPALTSRERSVWALAPPLTVYLILELGCPSVSKALDVPRLGMFHAAVPQIRRRTTADGGAASALDTVGAKAAA